MRPPPAAVSWPSVRTDRDGIALLIVMLLTMVVAAIAAGAALIGANSFLINQYDQKASLLESVADAGIELGRARLNANPGLYSDSSVATLEFDAAVYDAAGNVISGVSRTVYSIPLGGGLGEYGNFAALVSIAEDGEGTKAIRRLDLIQESFAIYGYFTDFEPSSIYFGSNDQLYGLVHSNSDIKINSSGATFHGDVTTAGSFVGAEYATFLGDTTSGVTEILMPTTGQITKLQDRAAPADLAFTGGGAGNSGQAEFRIHFISRDVDSDGVEEGFIRVYRSSDPDWVTARIPAGDSLGVTPNCGHTESDGSFAQVTNDTVGHSQNAVLTDSDSRCYLGGADELWATATNPDGEFRSTDALGGWVLYPGTVHDSVANEPHGDGAYLYPLDRELNSAFRGVIYVDGKVVVSGTVRGRLTLAATGNIIIGDDLVYNTDPGAGTCEDMLGLFSGDSVVVANNTINAPRLPPYATTTYRTYDDTSDEFIHASILALDVFTVHQPWAGSTTAEACNGQAWGRGCLAITGGLIQQERGIVAYGSGTGNMKSYSHDSCAFTEPPPYFPSTGHFYRGRYYEVDPTGFSISDYFDALN
jgi:cytoskeletal protein CcmA (bactofilin family)